MKAKSRRDREKILAAMMSPEVVATEGMKKSSLASLH